MGIFEKMGIFENCQAVFEETRVCARPPLPFKNGYTAVIASLHAALAIGEEALY
jgi:hypothetical protein